MFSEQLVATTKPIKQGPRNGIAENALTFAEKPSFSKVRPYHFPISPSPSAAHDMNLINMITAIVVSRILPS
jgi:hypothetical protein